MRSLLSTHLDRLTSPAAPLLGPWSHEKIDVRLVPTVRLLHPSPPQSCEAELVVLLPVLGIRLPSDLRPHNGSNGSLPRCSSAYPPMLSLKHPRLLCLLRPRWSLLPYCRNAQLFRRVRLRALLALPLLVGSFL